MKKIYLLSSLFAVLIFTGAGCIQFGSSGNGPVGIYQSNDKGDNWKPAVAMPTVSGVQNISNINVYRLHNDPQDNKAIYLASRGQGLYFSYDNALSWQNVPALNNKFIYGLAVDPKDKCTIYASDGQYIYKTEDCSRTWNQIYQEGRSDQRIISLAIDYANNNLIYAAEMGGDILVSENAGRGWRSVYHFDFQLQYLVADSFNPNRLYAAAYRRGLWRSDDNGKSWIDLSKDFDNFNDSNQFNRLVLNRGKKDSIFWVSKYGILRSDNAGASWEDLKLITPPGSVNIYAFDINPKNQNEMYYTGTILGDKNVNVRSTFYKTTDGGKNWVTKKLPTNTIPVWVLVNPDQDSNLTMGFTTL